MGCRPSTGLRPSTHPSAISLLDSGSCNTTLMTYTRLFHLKNKMSLLSWAHFPSEIPAFSTQLPSNPQSRPSPEAAVPKQCSPPWGQGGFVVVAVFCWVILCALDNAVVKQCGQSVCWCLSSHVEEGKRGFKHKLWVLLQRDPNGVSGFLPLVALTSGLLGQVSGVWFLSCLCPPHGAGGCPHPK